jgi:hypothetical protein
MNTEPVVTWGRSTRLCSCSKRRSDGTVPVCIVGKDSSLASNVQRALAEVVIRHWALNDAVGVAVVVSSHSIDCQELVDNVELVAQDVVVHSDAFTSSSE